LFFFHFPENNRLCCIFLNEAFTIMRHGECNSYGIWVFKDVKRSSHYSAQSCKVRNVCMCSGSEWSTACHSYSLFFYILSHFLSAFWVTVDALHEIFSQGLNPCPSRQRTISQSFLVLSSSWGLVTRLMSFIAITVIFGEMTRPVTYQSLRLSRYIFSQYFSVTYVHWHHSALFECCLANWGTWVVVWYHFLNYMYACYSPC